MTERISVDEARTRGYLGKGRVQSPGEAAADRRLKDAQRRHSAFLKLLKALLDTGHEIRLEHRWHASRRWRADVADLTARVILEIDGGGWIQGRHHRAEGRRKDNERDAQAQLEGWRVLRVDWAQVISGEAWAVVERMVRTAA